MKIEVRATPSETFSNAGGDVVFQKIAPYCDAPQIATNGEAVVQRFDKESARKLVSVFNSNMRRLFARLRFASPSLPVFNGHPDHGGNSDDEVTDNQIYAYVNRLEARDDGLWATIRKTPLLDDLKLALGRLEISPRWNCVGESGGFFKPVKLLSLGLVSKGNLPQACVINSKQEATLRKETTEMNDEQIHQLADLLGTEQNFSAVLDAVNALKTPATPAQEETAAQEAAEAETGQEEATAAATEEETKEENAKKDEKTEETAEAPAAEASEPETDPRDAEIATLKAQLEAANAAVAQAQRTEAAEIVKAALTNGRITPAQRPQVEALLAADFANAKALVETLPQAAVFSNGAAATAAAKEAAQSEPTDTREEATKKFYEMVNARTDRKRRIDFPRAVELVAATPEGAELRKQMRGL